MCVSIRQKKGIKVNKMECELKPLQSDMQVLKDTTLPIIIFGSSSVGQAIYYECKNNGIDIECFCDNSTSKIGTTKLGLNIVHPNDLKDKYSDVVFIISVADIKDIVLQLGQLGYDNFIAGGLLLKEFDINKYHFDSTYEYMDYAISTAVLCHEGYINKDKLYLRSIDIIITEKCSLKCEGCSNLSQYFETPQNDDINLLLEYIDKICEHIDDINEFRVIGGEPFMNNDIHLVIEKLISKQNVRKIVIFTNGTILPKKHQIPVLQEDKVLFVITDYGHLSKNTDTLEQLCIDNHIGYYREAVGGWTDCAVISEHSRTIEEQQDVFKRCCAKNLITLSQGKLFRCPFIANAYRLNAMPKATDDYVDVMADDPKTKEKISNFLLEITYLPGCDFCKGRFLDDEVIEPAIQLKQPLPYKKYL